MAGRQSSLFETKPVRVPKLLIRDQPRCSDEAECADLNQVRTESNSRTHFAASAPTRSTSRSTTDTFQSSQRRHGKQPRSHPTAEATVTKPSSAKKGSRFLNFLSAREPSSSALKDYSKQQCRQDMLRGVRSTAISPVAARKLPDHVPKVNSKWDGMPRLTSRQPLTAGVTKPPNLDSGIFQGKVSVARSANSWVYDPSRTGPMASHPIAASSVAMQRPPLRIRTQSADQGNSQPLADTQGAEMSPDGSSLSGSPDQELPDSGRQSTSDLPFVNEAQWPLVPQSSRALLRTYGRDSLQQSSNASSLDWSTESDRESNEGTGSFEPLARSSSNSIKPLDMEDAHNELVAEDIHIAPSRTSSKERQDQHLDPKEYDKTGLDELQSSDRDITSLGHPKASYGVSTEQNNSCMERLVLRSHAKQESVRVGWPRSADTGNRHDISSHDARGLTLSITEVSNTVGKGSRRKSFREYMKR